MDAAASNKLSDGIDAPLWVFWKRRRYIVVMMAFLGFMNMYSMRTNLSVAIVAMTENRTVEYANGTVHYEQYFNWNSKVQGYVLSSFFYGYLVTQVPGGYVSNWFGPHIAFGIGVGGSAVLTLLTPLAANAGVGYVIAVRILEGVFQGVTLPCMHSVWARWAPPFERSRMVLYSFAGIFVGTILGMLLSGVMAKNWNWESVFYFFGALGCVWYVGWVILVKNSPEDDRHITPNEKEFILKSIGRVEQDNQRVKHPWKGILTSTAVYGLITANFCNNYGFYTLLTQLPRFLKDAMHFGVQSSGMIAAVPYFGMSITLYLAGYFADWFQIKGILTTTQVRRNFNCGAFVVQSVCLIIAAAVFTPVVSIIFITLAISASAFAWSGYAVNHLDLSPKSAGLLMGISNSFGTASGIITPIVVGYLTSGSSPAEWKMVFYIAAGVYLFGLVVYWFWASGELQPWSIEVQEREKKEREAKKECFVYVNKINLEE
ncbi:vesicular glutamate transporter 2-like [Armigeres subalbatus]|uniref:vesicular glutamate transporter 2-like n=1 Tax=Armigeres subalbatus TaxID=124917 RepID=UPI002ED1ECE4